MSDIDAIRQTLKAIVGKSYNLITQGESVSQLRQPSARAIYDLARDAQPILSRVEQELAAAREALRGWEASRDEIESRWRALGNMADQADDDGDHVGFARRYRGLQDGIGEAHRLLDPANRAALAAVPQTDQIREDDPSEVHPPDSRAESQAGLNGPSGSPTSSSRRVLEWIADPSYVGNYDDATVVAIYRGWARHALAAVPQEGKEPCLYPLPDGRRCLECATCQPVPQEGKRGRDYAPPPGVDG